MIGFCGDFFVHFLQGKCLINLVAEVFTHPDLPDSICENKKAHKKKAA